MFLSGLGFSYDKPSGASNGLLTGLVSYYGLDSDATDETGSYDGTATNVTRDTSDYILGSAAGDFNNSGDGVNTNHKTTIGARSRSLRFKSSATATKMLLDNCNNSSAGRGDTMRLNQWVTNKLGYFIPRGSAGNYVKVSSATTVNDGNRHHVVVTTKGNSTASDTKMYIDGSLDASGTQVGTAGTPGGTASNNDFIGRSAAGTEGFDGSIDGVGERNVELTATQVSQLYNSGNGLPYSNFTS